MELTPEMFEEEMSAALKTYDQCVVCLEKSPDECRDSLDSLLRKAIKAYNNRGEGLRHGLALDPQVTIILSQQEGTDRPLCGIYFNLYSPHKKRGLRPATSNR